MSLFITYVSSTCFGPHRSIIRSVLQAVFADLVCVIRVLLDTSSRYLTAGRVEKYVCILLDCIYTISDHFTVRLRQIQKYYENYRRHVSQRNKVTFSLILCTLNTFRRWTLLTYVHQNDDTHTHTALMIYTDNKCFHWRRQVLPKPAAKIHDVSSVHMSLYVTITCSSIITRSAQLSLYFIALHEHKDRSREPVAGC